MRCTSVAVTAFVLVVGLTGAAAARANNTGIFGRSGRDAEGGTCTSCHLGNNGSGPAVTVEGLDGKLVANGFAQLTITVTSNDPSGGIAEAACPERCAGLNAAVSAGGGTFAIPDGSILQANAERDEISHIAKSPFVDGKVVYEVALAGLVQGEHTLFVAGNDVDGQVVTGDRVTAVSFPFTVGAQSVSNPPDDTEPGGCGSDAGTGRGAPRAVLALLLGALVFRRRGRRT